MDFLKYTEDSKFRALVTRRINPQIHGPGGIFETFVNLHRKVYGDKLKIRKRDGVIEYPSGATITFRHCQYEEDKHSFQGWQLAAYLGDEIQQMTESQVIYIMSRLRSEATNKPVFRGTCNPAGKGHWLTKWVEWYLLPTGLPDPEKCGKTRWFTMRDNEMLWGDSREEVIEQVPGCNPLSFTFISANVYDNPVLMKRQPEYVAWLEGQDRETKEALLYGNWYVTKQYEGFVKRSNFKIVEEPPFGGRRIRGFDMAGSVPDEINKGNCDYTATVLMSKTGDKYCIEHVHRFQKRFHDVEEYILNLSKVEDDDIVYCLVVDPGAAGLAYSRSLQQKIAMTGRFVIMQKTGGKSKMSRFKPLASVIQSGAVSVVDAAWNDWYFQELEEFTENDKHKHDDALDATVTAFWALNQERQLPAFTLPTDLNGSSLPSFGFQNNSLPLEMTQGLPLGFN